MIHFQMFHQLHEMLLGVNKNGELAVLQVWSSLEEAHMSKSQSLDNNVRYVTGNNRKLYVKIFLDTSREGSCFSSKVHQTKTHNKTEQLT